MREWGEGTGTACGERGRFLLFDEAQHKKRIASRGKAAARRWKVNDDRYLIVSAGTLALAGGGGRLCDFLY